MRRQQTSDRGVSTVVGYILALSITTVLVGGLIVGSTTFLRSQQERVADETLAVVGEQLSTAITTVDAPPNGQTEQVTVELPDRVAGQQYEIQISDEEQVTSTLYRYRITLRTDSPPAEVQVPITTQNEIQGVSATSGIGLNGGDLRVERTSSGQLVITNA